MGTAVASTVDPWFVNTALNMSEARYALSALVGRDPTSNTVAETGVLPGGVTPFLPTSNGTAGAPRVSVAAGHCILTTSGGGTYVCTWPSAANVSLTAPAGNPRIDVLCARVRDTDVDASGVKLFELITVDGTPAASPAVPATPAGYVALYQILCATNGTLTLTDVRPFTRAAGGLRVAIGAAALARAGSYTGDLRVTATGVVDVWLTSTWVTVATPMAWTSFTPTLTSSSGSTPLGGAGASAIGRYIVIGKVLHLRYIFRAGASMGATWGDVWSTLPPGLTSAPQEETQILAKLNAHWPAGVLQAIYLGKAFIPPSSTVMNLYFPYSTSRSDLHTYMMSLDSGVIAGTGFPTVAGGYALPGILVIQGTVEIT
jgi:hypothetical protein